MVKSTVRFSEAVMDRVGELVSGETFDSTVLREVNLTGFY